MITYENLAKTCVLLAKYKPDCPIMDWAEHDEWGIDLRGFDLSAAEIRQLAEMGWGLGSDSEYDEEAMQAWEHPKDHTDEEIAEVFNCYQSIYKYA